MIERIVATTVSFQRLKAFDIVSCARLCFETPIETELVVRDRIGRNERCACLIGVMSIVIRFADWIKSRVDRVGNLLI